MLLRLRAMAIALMLIVPLPTYAQQAPPLSNLPQNGQQQPTQQKTNRDGSAQQTTENKSDTPGHGSAVVDPGKPPHENGGTRQGTEDGKRKDPDQGSTRLSWQRFSDKIFDDPVAFFTVWVAVFTAVLAASTIGLWRQTRRLAEQAVEASKDTKRSIEIAETASLETSRAAQAAVDAVFTERAWMSFGDLSSFMTDGHIGNIKYDKMLAFHPSWVNSGRSPALNATISWAQRCAPINDKIGKFQLDHNASGATVIGPGAINYTAGFALGGQDLDDFISRKTCVIYYCSVRYRVVGDNNTDRYTEVCGRIVYQGNNDKTGATMKPYTPFVPEGPQNTAT